MNYADTKAMALSIIEHIHEDYGVDIVDGGGERYTSDLRKMYCTYMHRNTRMTMQNISDILGKSVGNISYAISMHDKKMGESSGYADNYTDFQDRIKESATI